MPPRKSLSKSKKRRSLKMKCVLGIDLAFATVAPVSMARSGR